MADEKTPETRAAYPHILPIQTRWMDNDIYGHVNNVTYYSYFDTVVNSYLIDVGGLDIHDGTVVGFAVETTCRFFKPVAFPEKLAAGLRVGKLGNSSVRYEIAIFKDGEDTAAAAGHFVHVFVDRRTDRPTPVPAAIRAALEKLVVGMGGK
ncbi:MAG TPA: thioesterase [Rhodospirillaceae bacterium]|jgi:acyl-CoA thioester hydrolase|nr:thioesterase [Rhodospirillaceae bacterium]HCS70573.1 thioesterase [Rhodospirillaceae bacterium]|tara:strand:+ start:23310 stop:23762 length:453 start_codon:yes stop_codon:yes gene_type:complete